jgi:hypothetical protein
LYKFLLVCAVQQIDDYTWYKTCVEVSTSNAQQHFAAPLNAIPPQLEGAQGEHSCEDIHATGRDVTFIVSHVKLIE